MSKFFNHLMTGSLEDNSSTKSEALVNSEMDDLDLPDGSEMPSTDEMKKTLELTKQAQLESPTTPRPDMARRPSSQPLVDIDEPSASTDDSGADIGHDPDDDDLSTATDLNRHQRAIDEIGQSLQNMSKRIDLVPELDSSIRKILGEMTDMKSRVALMRGEIDSVRKSFNLYQSGTANKIADVERRAAERQLSVTAKAETSIIPPDEVSATRDGPALDPSSAPPLKPTTPRVVKKTVANMSDW